MQGLLIAYFIGVGLTVIFTGIYGVRSLEGSAPVIVSTIITAAIVWPLIVLLGLIAFVRGMFTSADGGQDRTETHDEG